MPLKMSLKKILIILFSTLIISFTLIFSYLTFWNMWDDAIKNMTKEEKQIIEKVEIMSVNMTKKEIIEILWEPTNDTSFILKWTWMWDSNLSQWRVYFSNWKPYKFRFIKLWSFFYETKF